MIYIVLILLILGCFFAMAGTVGMIRMPDVYCRMQSSTNIATFGSLGAILACAVYSFAYNSIATGIKILVIGILIILTNPIGGHAICKAAYKYGIRPEKQMKCDMYGRDSKDEL